MKGKNKTIAIVVGIASDLINDGNIILDKRNGWGGVSHKPKVKWFQVVGLE